MKTSITAIVSSGLLLFAAACTGEIGSPQRLGHRDVDAGGGARCGDGRADEGEACDGRDLRGAACRDLDERFVGGVLSCADDCTLLDEGCEAEPPAICGDGEVNGAEQCDGRALNDTTCLVAGFDGGVLGCTEDCHFDLGGCRGDAPECGDGIVEGLEVCDGAELAGSSCLSEGYDGGTLHCMGDCMAFDVAECTRCGNGIIETGEGCEGGDVVDFTCQDQGFDEGSLGCDDSCQLDVSGCTRVTCGNGSLDPLEDCEPGLSHGGPCGELPGFEGGRWSCRPNCTYDTSSCTHCGDGRREGSETCDGADLGGVTCATVPDATWTAGTLRCAATCDGWDVGACTECGDGTVAGAEECEGGELGGATCRDVGDFDAGTLGCHGAACRFDTSGCTACGDGIIEGDEDCEEGDESACVALDPVSFEGGTATCDPSCHLDTSDCQRITCGNHVIDTGEDCEADIADATTCADLPNFDGGPLACGAGCTWDTSACTECGDGSIEGDEECEGQDLAGLTCATLPSSSFDAGTLACTSACRFDTSGCSRCGNGSLEPGEACEGTNLGGATCADLPAFDAGTLACQSSTCTLDTSACTSCGDGVAEGAEQCDGGDIGETCHGLNPGYVAGALGCTSACLYDTSGCEAAPDDTDSDGVVDANDPAPSDPYVCGDSDTDGCDDCSLEGTHTPANDGYDADGDGSCEMPLDTACMTGRNAPTDPSRLEACLMFAYVNADRAFFSDESSGGAPLQWNEDIWEVAMAHAVDMCTRHFFAHTNPDGLGPSDRAAAAGLPYWLSENISVNLDPGAAMWGFMDEPTCRGHRGNILSASAIEVGIGYHKCTDPGTTSIPCTTAGDCPDYHSCDGSTGTCLYEWRNHHHIVQDFRSGSGSSAYCADAATSCEIPPTPPTTAPCPPQLVSWGFCPDPGPDSIAGWGCPND